MDDQVILLLISDPILLGQLKEKLINYFRLPIIESIPDTYKIKRILKEKNVATIIAEQKGPANKLINIISKIKVNWPSVVFIVISENDGNTIREFFTQGADDFWLKSTEISNYFSKLKSLIDQNIEKQSLPQKEWEIIGQSKPILKVKREIEQYASSDISILIQGETGTGKELVARQLHLLSERKNKLYIPINLSGLEAPTAGSELFGHVKGAFTDAIKDRKGAFELAGTGSVLLDEIHKTHTDILNKLLRVLQEKEFSKLGSNEILKMHARFMAATNKNLLDLVENGKFPMDLYYRLFPPIIFLPPLREIPEDMPLLADHFLKKYAKKSKKEMSHISDEAQNALIDYQWPGNIRELEKNIILSVIKSNGSVIRAEDLPEQLFPDNKIVQCSIPPTKIESAGEELGVKHDENVVSEEDLYINQLKNLLHSNLSLNDRANEYKRIQVQFTVAENNGKPGKAAESLGCDRHTIANNLKKK